MRSTIRFVAVKREEKPATLTRSSSAASEMLRAATGARRTVHWQFLKAGQIDRGPFTASSEDVPQGGVLSPLLSKIMLHEFDAWSKAEY